MSSPLHFPGALLLLVGSGWLWVSADGQRRAPLHLLALAHLTGTAVLAAGVVWSLAFFDEVRAWLPLAAMLLLGLAGLLRSIRNPPANAVPEPQVATPSAARATAVTGSSLFRGSHRYDFAVTLLLAVGLATAASRVWLLPLDWDGWAIWQLKARAMVAGDLKALLTDPRYHYSHVDYPLLVPAHSWWLCGGTFSERVAQAGGLIFLVDLLVLFYYETGRRIGDNWARVGCVALLSWALVPKHTASGFADLPMAVYAFGAITLLAENRISTFGPLLIGAALTKNEGLFTLGACIAFALWRLRLREAEPSGGDAPVPAQSSPLLGVVSAIGLSILPWAEVKRRWSLTSEFLDPHHWPSLDAAESVARLSVVAQGFARQFLGIGPWYPGWGFTWLLAATALYLSARHRLRETVPYWILVAAHFAGATAAYLLTNTDPALHLDRSLDRLMLQVAPAALFATLLALNARAIRARARTAGDPSSPPA